VRCGACNEVFDGNAALIDLDVVETAHAAAPEAESAPASEPVPAAEISSPEQPAIEAVPEQSASAAFDAEVVDIEAKQAERTEEPIFTLDFDTTFDPFGILPKPEPEPQGEPEPENEPEPEVEPESEPEPEPEPEVDEEIVALPAPEEELDQGEDALEPPPAPVRDAPDLLPSLLMRESAAAEPAPEVPPALPAASPKLSRRGAKRAKPAPKPVEMAEPEPAPADDEPEFVRRIRRQEATGRTRRIVMGAASALLVLALAAQAMTTFRNVLAARYPDLKPVLAATCAAFGCKVELPAQIDMLSVETGELQSLGANTFSYTTLLRDQGSLVQAWPHIELALTDTNDKPVVRRVFGPAEYLPAGVAAARGFGPRSEQAVKLSFELNQVKASGYHIAIFYP
jgi:hypothetical protein